MDASRSELVSAYWLYQSLSQGSRAERLEATNYFWACEAVSELIHEGDVLSAVDVLDDLLAATEADILYVGVGPIEDLLSLRGQEVVAVVTERCRESLGWRSAVASVWLTVAERAGLESLLTYLPPMAE